MSKLGVFLCLALFVACANATFGVFGKSAHGLGLWANGVKTSGENFVSSIFTRPANDNNQGRTALTPLRIISPNGAESYYKVDLSSNVDNVIDLGGNNGGRLPLGNNQGRIGYSLPPWIPPPPVQLPQPSQPSSKSLHLQSYLNSLEYNDVSYACRSILHPSN